MRSASVMELIKTIIMNIGNRMVTRNGFAPNIYKHACAEQFDFHKTKEGKFCAKHTLHNETRSSQLLLLLRTSVNKMAWNVWITIDLLLMSKCL